MHWTDPFNAVEAGFISELSDDDDVVLVAFSGLNLTSGLGIPPFEFSTLIGDLPVGKVFIRDLDQAWYHGGVRGLGTSIPEVAVRLRALLGDRKRLVFVGHSSGGYGAMLFGSLLRADVVVATSPQTFVGRWLRRWHKDARFVQEIDNVHASPERRRRYLDLKPLLHHPRGASEIQIYYSAQHPLDTCHATRVGGIRRVTLHPQPYETHSLVRVMRDDGSLIPILRASLGLT